MKKVPPHDKPRQRKKRPEIQMYVPRQKRAQLSESRAETDEVRQSENKADVSRKSTHHQHNPTPDAKIESDRLTSGDPLPPQSQPSAQSYHASLRERLCHEIASTQQKNESQIMDVVDVETEFDDIQNKNDFSRIPDSASLDSIWWLCDRDTSPSTSQYHETNHCIDEHEVHVPTHQHSADECRNHKSKTFKDYRNMIEPVFYGPALPNSALNVNYPSNQDSFTSNSSFKDVESVTELRSDLHIKDNISRSSDFADLITFRSPAYNLESDVGNIHVKSSERTKSSLNDPSQVKSDHTSKLKSDVHVKVGAIYVPPHRRSVPQKRTPHHYCDQFGGAVQNSIDSDSLLEHKRPERVPAIGEHYDAYSSNIDLSSKEKLIDQADFGNNISSSSNPTIPEPALCDVDMCVGENGHANFRNHISSRSNRHQPVADQTLHDLPIQLVSDPPRNSALHHNLSDAVEDANEIGITECCDVNQDTKTVITDKGVVELSYTKDTHVDVNEKGDGCETVIPLLSNAASPDDVIHNHHISTTTTTSSNVGDLCKDTENTKTACTIECPEHISDILEDTLSAREVLNGTEEHGQIVNENVGILKDVTNMLEVNQPLHSTEPADVITHDDIHQSESLSQIGQSDPDIPSNLVPVPESSISVHIADGTQISSSTQDGQSESVIQISQSESVIQINQSESMGENNQEEAVEQEQLVADMSPSTLNTDNQSEAKVEKGITDESDDSSDEEDVDEDGSWDVMFTDEGTCLDPKMLEELTTAVGSVEVQKPQVANYYKYQPKDADLDYEDYSHVVEISGFPAEFTTKDLLSIFNSFMSRGFDVSWVDDTHALGIFSSQIAAQDALTMVHPLVKIQHLSQAATQSKQKAKRCIEFLQPYKARPATSAMAARRLVTGALGLAPRMTREQRDSERKQIKDAKAKKRDDRKNRSDAWEGNYGKCAMDEGS